MLRMASSGNRFRMGLESGAGLNPGAFGRRQAGRRSGLGWLLVNRNTGDTRRLARLPIYRGRGYPGTTAKAERLTLRVFRIAAIRHQRTSLTGVLPFFRNVAVVPGPVGQETDARKPGQDLRGCAGRRPPGGLPGGQDLAGLFLGPVPDFTTLFGLAVLAGIEPPDRPIIIHRQLYHRPWPHPTLGFGRIWGIPSW